MPKQIWFISSINRNIEIQNKGSELWSDHIYNVVFNPIIHGTSPLVKHGEAEMLSWMWKGGREQWI